MSIDEFKLQLINSDPDISLSDYMKALWYDAKGNWQKAHSIVQDIHSKEAASIHAYLHRKEGDLGNAEYWYQRAGMRLTDLTADEEWDVLVAQMINVT